MSSRPGKLIRLGQLANLYQTAVTRYRPRLLTHKLHAVEVLGVVAGRHHNPPIHAGMAGGKINLFRAAQADVVHIHTLLAQAIRQCRLDRLAGEPNVVADHHLARLHHLGIRAANTARNILIELVGHPPADVIRLEAI